MRMIRPVSLRYVILLCGWEALVQATLSALEPSVKDYPTIQKALDSNPGRLVYVPPGDYTISDKIRIRHDNSGLSGPGRILQSNPEQPIIAIENAANVRMHDLTLTRREGRTEAKAEGVLAIGCENLVLDNLQILDNRAAAGAIVLRECVNSQVRNCQILNYMRISVDDRTSSADWGYAFKCIDGSGVVVRESKGILLQGNRVIEKALLPTPEIKEKFNLGKFTKKNPQKGALVSQKVWNEEYTDNWHQGSAIVVTSPEVTARTQILDNYIENAAQGIDIHADHVIVAHNIVNNAHIGMKAMHGSRNVLIMGNQFIKNDLWSIGLMPGAASHPALPARDSAQSTEANVDGGSIIANNIISDFGYGNAHWVWGTGAYTCSPIKFDAGQKAGNPPLTDVIIQGNIVYDCGRDQVMMDGKPTAEPPRYKYAVCVAREVKGLHFLANIFHPGTHGVANVELPP